MALNSDPKQIGPAVKAGPGVESFVTYAPPRHPAPIALRLSANEGAMPSLGPALQSLRSESIRCYPDARPLESDIARHNGIDPSRVIVTAGADDALWRVMRAMCAPGRNVVLPVPTFEMLDRYIVRNQGTPRYIEWHTGSYPIEAVRNAVDDATCAICVVSPNSPTGAIATEAQFRELCEQFPQVLIVLDQAYVEYADVDLGPVALEYPNAVVAQTFSKAWGLAGLRVGYAMGDPSVIGWLRAVGQPYSVSAASLAAARHAFANNQEDMRRHVQTVRRSVDKLSDMSETFGLSPRPSQANFVLIQTEKSEWIADALAGIGIYVRRDIGGPLLRDCIRITCPEQDANWGALSHGLESSMDPQGFIFDMDGVLADTSASFDVAVLKTAASFGYPITEQALWDARAAGGANDDWALTQRLISDAGRVLPLEDVRQRFQAIYQGSSKLPGLRDSETLLVDRFWLADLAGQYPLAVVTGRPKIDAEYFIKLHQLEKYFTAVISRDDAPMKPAPDPVLLALKRLSIRRAWMFGDTPDDVKAARGAGVIPVGIRPPGVTNLYDNALLAAGASQVWDSVMKLSEFIG